MRQSLTDAADDILKLTVGRAGGAPGVVAMACDRHANLYEGAAGVRELGSAAPMTTDTVMFLASCTKAVTGVALMQLVEEARNITVSVVIGAALPSSRTPAAPS